MKVLNQKLKEKWLKALRSNKYRQGLESLRTWRNSFCCLGVLCDVFYSKGWEVVRKGYGGRPQFSFFYKKEGDGMLVPKTVRQEIGLDTKDMRKLANMNDNSYSFREIADYIEENL